VKDQHFVDSQITKAEVRVVGNFEVQFCESDHSCWITESVDLRLNIIRVRGSEFGRMEVSQISTL
jgi:hypothetical protein